jgi:hypothetical protein
MSLKEKIIEKITTRDIVTLAVTGLVVYAGRAAQLSQENIFAIVMLVLGFWFGEKTQVKFLKAIDGS